MSEDDQLPVDVGLCEVSDAAQLSVIAGHHHGAVQRTTQQSVDDLWRRRVVVFYQ